VNLSQEGSPPVCIELAVLGSSDLEPHSIVALSPSCAAPHTYVLHVVGGHSGVQPAGPCMHALQHRRAEPAWGATLRVSEAHACDSAGRT